MKRHYVTIEVTVYNNLAEKPISLYSRGCKDNNFHYVFGSLN